MTKARRLFRGFLFKGNDQSIHPPYFFTTIMLTLIVIMTMVKPFTTALSDTLMLGAWSFFAAWVVSYNVKSAVDKRTAKKK